MTHHGSIAEVSSLFIDPGWHVIFDSNTWATNEVDWLGNQLRSTGPIDLPLWFVRDLIIVTLLSPAIYYYVKRLGIWACQYYLSLMYQGYGLTGRAFR